MLRFSILIVLLIGLESFSHAEEGGVTTYGGDVSYDIEPCCNLCSALQDPSSYESRKLSGMKFIRDGRNGWLFRSEDDFMTEFGPDEFNIKQLSQFVSMLNQVGTELAILYIPTRGMMQSDQIIDLKSVGYDFPSAKNAYASALNNLRSTGAIVPDMTLAFESIEGDYFFKRDHHWTPGGAKHSAQILAAEIKKQTLYSSLKKSTFKTQEVNRMRRTGQLQLAVKRICGFDYPFQYVKNYETQSIVDDISSDNAESVLFGDDDLPEVVLAGTSNSWNNKNDFNFSGFLKESLGVDILNESIAGGNFDGSILRYLLSEEFRLSPPKLLIWEMPSYYNLNEPIFYRRARPMISGGCDHRKVVLESKTQLLPGKNEILFNGGGEVKRLKSKDLIIDLQFDNPEFRELYAYTWYVHGRREPIRMRVTDRVDMQGRFIFEAMPTPEWEDFLYLSMDVELPDLSEVSKPKMPTSVTAKACLKDY